MPSRPGAGRAPRRRRSPTPPGPWDAVAIVDMLYLLPAIEQRRLLAEAVAELAPSGLLVVKEMGTGPRWKYRWNTWQETLAVRVLRITEGSSFDFVAPAVMAGWLHDLGLTTTTRRLDRGRLHPHHLLVGKRVARDADSNGSGGRALTST